MATLSEHKAKNPNSTLGKGTSNRQLGGKDIASSAPVKPGGFVNKLLDVGTQVGSMSGSLGKKTAGFVKNTGVDIYQKAFLATRSLAEMQTQGVQAELYARESEKLGLVQDKINASYRSGKMSLEDYKKASDDLAKATSALNKENKKIYQGPSPFERAEAVAETAVNVLSLGSWGLTGAGTKQAFTAGSINKIVNGKKVFTGAIDKNGISALVKEIATPLENFIMKVPAARDLIERNLTAAAKREAQKVVGESTAQFISREAKNIAVDLLIKRPIFYQMNIGEANKVYDKILEGDYPAALRASAWLGTQMLSGGPIGAVARGAGWTKRTTGKLAHGTGSWLDNVSREIGDKNPKQLSAYLQSLKGKPEFDSAHNILRIGQEVNLRIAKEDAEEAARYVLDHYRQNNIPLESINPAKFIKDLGNWAEADAVAQRTIRQGLIPGVSPKDAAKYVVVRWDASTKKALAYAVESGADKAEQLAILENLATRPGAGWGNNSILMNKLRTIVRESDNVGRDIRGITTASSQVKGVPKKIANRLTRLGYTIARPAGGRKTPLVDVDETRKLIAGAVDGDISIFDPATAPQPQIASIAHFFEKLGLSPVEANTSANRKLSESIVVSLDSVNLSKNLGLRSGKNKDVVNGGHAILSKLQDYVEHKPGILGRGKSAVIDIRQLTPSEIANALDVTRTEGRAISNAIMKGYQQVPMEIRGLGDKIVDNLYTYNPLHKYYSRIQSALRYTYNPFFRTQERTETKILSHLQGSNLIWNRGKAQLDDAAKLLDDGGIFSSSFSGVGAQDQIIGRITANITKGQKRDLAGLAMDMAEARGMTLQEMLLQHSDEIDDALRVVVQYPRRGLLASPLARTMNLMFFPMRYNVKVTQLAAQALAKQPPSVQLAVIHAGFKMRDWLKSDEGIQWQSQHADAIQVFNWLTPVNSIQYTMNLLKGPDSLAEMGQLGGLPLGFITQILDNQGVIQLNRPYVNPKTGDVFPDYVPQEAKARASVALIDLLGSMFTFPGRTLGLPGKEASLRKLVREFIATNGSDFDKRIETERLTPLQKNWVRVLKGDTSEEAIDALYNSPAPGQFQYYTLPPLDLPIRSPLVKEPVARRTNLPRKGTSSRRKKPTAQPIPQG